MGFLPKKLVPKKEIEDKKEEIRQVEEELKGLRKDDDVKEVTDDKKEKHEYFVVKELPTQQIRETTTDEGTIMHFITIEEALTKFMNE